MTSIIKLPIKENLLKVKALLKPGFIVRRECDDYIRDGFNGIGLMKKDSCFYYLYGHSFMIGWIPRFPDPVDVICIWKMSGKQRRIFKLEMLSRQRS